MSLGFIRWVQMYGEFATTNNDYFPVFDGLFRKNDKYGLTSDSLEGERDQGAGIFGRWVWQDAKAEIYGELNYNDAKYNLRDFNLRYLVTQELIPLVFTKFFKKHQLVKYMNFHGREH
jgi:hypothetical protein